MLELPIYFISDNQRPVYADGNPRTDWLYADETNTEDVPVPEVVEDSNSESSNESEPKPSE